MYRPFRRIGASSTFADFAAISVVDGVSWLVLHQVRTCRCALSLFQTSLRAVSNDTRRTVVVYIRQTAFLPQWQGKCNGEPQTVCEQE